MSDKDIKSSLSRRTPIIYIGWLMAVVLAFSAIAMSCVALGSGKRVEYTESSDIDYAVQLRENDFYDSASLAGGGAYVAELIDRIEAELKYEFDIEGDCPNIEYDYDVTARLEIIDEKANTVILKDDTGIVERKGSSSDGKILICEPIEIDYSQYNLKAKEFVSKYALRDTASRLVLSLKADVLVVGESNGALKRRSYDVQLLLPLVEPTVRPEIIRTVPEADRAIFTEVSGNKALFMSLAVSFGMLDIILIGYLCVSRFAHSSGGKYSKKLKKILTSYGDYIQRLKNELDKDGYKVIYLDSFEDILGVRDSLRSPILMYENESSAEFAVLGATNVVYIFELNREE